MPSPIKENSTAIKEALIELLSKMKGLPAEKKQQYEAMLTLLKDPKTVVNDEQKKMVAEISQFLFLIFQGYPSFMNQKNKKMVEEFSEKNLSEPTKKPSHGRKKS